MSAGVVIPLAVMFAGAGAYVIPWRRLVASWQDHRARRQLARSEERLRRYLDRRVLDDRRQGWRVSGITVPARFVDELGELRVGSILGEYGLRRTA